MSIYGVKQSANAGNDQTQRPMPANKVEREKRGPNSTSVPGVAAKKRFDGAHWLSTLFPFGQEKNRGT
jgi:hypothetical protein